MRHGIYCKLKSSAQFLSVSFSDCGSVVQFCRWCVESGEMAQVLKDAQCKQADVECQSLLTSQTEQVSSRYTETVPRNEVEWT